MTTRLLLAGLLVGLLAGCGEAPKFKVGDCVEADIHRERWMPGLITKIAEIGVKAYRTTRADRTPGDAPTIWFYEQYLYRVVECPR